MRNECNQRYPLGVGREFVVSSNVMVSRLLGDSYTCSFFHLRLCLLALVIANHAHLAVEQPSQTFLSTLGGSGLKIESPMCPGSVHACMGAS